VVDPVDDGRKAVLEFDDDALTTKMSG